MDESLRDWASLPAHILDLIVFKLESFSDFVRFCGICPQWRYCSLEAKIDHNDNLDLLKASHKKLPMLMFKTDSHTDGVMSLYSVSDRVIYNCKLPSPYKYRFAGSSLGWLFNLEKNMAVTLVNPCNNSRITLPVLKNSSELFRAEWHKRLFDYYITKGILLSDPHLSSSYFGVAVTYGTFRKLALFTSGEPSWNFINPESDFRFGDIIFYKGKLYGVDECGDNFVEIDLYSKTMISIISSSGDCFFGRIYLVESQDGELLMVTRMWGYNPDVIEPCENHQVEEEALNSGNEENDDDYVDYLDSESESSDNVSETIDNESQSSERITIYNVDDDLPKSFEFKVFKMTNAIEEGSAKWVEMKNIGEQAIFVGDNQSVSVSTTEFPGCLPNSVYFTSESHFDLPPYEYCGPNEDSGIFNLEDGSFSPHHVLCSTNMYMQPPIWFIPNP